MAWGWNTPLPGVFILHVPPEQEPNGGQQPRGLERRVVRKVDCLPGRVTDSTDCCYRDNFVRKGPQLQAVVPVRSRQCIETVRHTLMLFDDPDASISAGQSGLAPIQVFPPMRYPPAASAPHLKVALVYQSGTYRVRVRGACSNGGLRPIFPQRRMSLSCWVATSGSCRALEPPMTWDSIERTGGSMLRLRVTAGRVCMFIFGFIFGNLVLSTCIFRNRILSQPYPVWEDKVLFVIGES
jgi:hypothetical protein